MNRRLEEMAALMRNPLTTSPSHPPRPRVLLQPDREEFWMELRARVHGRTVEEERAKVQELRAQAPTLIRKVQTFCLPQRDGGEEGHLPVKACPIEDYCRAIFSALDNSLSQSKTSVKEFRVDRILSFCYEINAQSSAFPGFISLNAVKAFAVEMSKSSQITLFKTFLAYTANRLPSGMWLKAVKIWKDISAGPVANFVDPHLPAQDEEMILLEGLKKAIDALTPFAQCKALLLELDELEGAWGVTFARKKRGSNKGEGRLISAAPPSLSALHPEYRILDRSPDGQGEVLELSTDSTFLQNYDALREWVRIMEGIQREEQRLNSLFRKSHNWHNSPDLDGILHRVQLEEFTNSILQPLRSLLSQTKELCCTDCLDPSCLSDTKGNGIPHRHLTATALIFRQMRLPPVHVSLSQEVFPFHSSSVDSHRHGFNKIDCGVFCQRTAVGGVANTPLKILTEIVRSRGLTSNSVEALEETLGGKISCNSDAMRFRIDQLFVLFESCKEFQEELWEHLDGIPTLTAGPTDAEIPEVELEPLRNSKRRGRPHSGNSDHSSRHTLHRESTNLSSFSSIASLTAESDMANAFFDRTHVTGELYEGESLLSKFLLHRLQEALSLLQLRVRMLIGEVEQEADFGDDRATQRKSLKLRDLARKLAREDLIKSREAAGVIRDTEAMQLCAKWHCKILTSILHAATKILNPSVASSKRAQPNSAQEPAGDGRLESEPESEHDAGPATLRRDISSSSETSDMQTARFSKQEQTDGILGSCFDHLDWNEEPLSSPCAIAAFETADLCIRIAAGTYYALGNSRLYSFIKHNPFVEKLVELDYALILPHDHVETRSSKNEVDTEYCFISNTVWKDQPDSWQQAYRKLTTVSFGSSEEIQGHLIRVSLPPKSKAWGQSNRLVEFWKAQGGHILSLAHQPLHLPPKEVRIDNGKEGGFQAPTGFLTPGSSRLPQLLAESGRRVRLIAANARNLPYEASQFEAGMHIQPPTGRWSGPRPNDPKGRNLAKVVCELHSATRRDIDEHLQRMIRAASELQDTAAAAALAIHSNRPLSVHALSSSTVEISGTATNSSGHYSTETTSTPVALSYSALSHSVSSHSSDMLESEFDTSLTHLRSSSTDGSTPGAKQIVSAIKACLRGFRLCISYPSMTLRPPNIFLAKAWAQAVLDGSEHKQLRREIKRQLTEGIQYLSSSLEIAAPALEEPEFEAGLQLLESIVDLYEKRTEKLNSESGSQRPGSGEPQNGRVVPPLSSSISSLSGTEDPLAATQPTEGHVGVRMGRVLSDEEHAQRAEVGGSRAVSWVKGEAIKFRKKVFKAHLCHDNRTIAARELRVQEGAVERVLRRGEVMKELRHPHILIHYAVTPANTARTLLYLLTEFCPEGSLDRLLTYVQDHPPLSATTASVSTQSHQGGLMLPFQGQHDGPVPGPRKRRGPLLPTGQIKLYAWQLVSAMEHLHELKLYHGAIRSSSAFLTRNGQVLKLGDIVEAEAARNQSSMISQVSESPQETQLYVSPALTSGKELDRLGIGCVSRRMLLGMAEERLSLEGLGAEGQSVRDGAQGEGYNSSSVMSCLIAFQVSLRRSIRNVSLPQLPEPYDSQLPPSNMAPTNQRDEDPSVPLNTSHNAAVPNSPLNSMMEANTTTRPLLHSSTASTLVQFSKSGSHEGQAPNQDSRPLISSQPLSGPALTPILKPDSRGQNRGSGDGQAGEGETGEQRLVEGIRDAQELREMQQGLAFVAACFEDTLGADVQETRLLDCPFLLTTKKGFGIRSA